MMYKAKLVNVLSGELEEYADLVGEKGRLQLTSESCSPHLNFFLAENGSDLGLFVKRVTKKQDNTIIVKTQYGNTFVFRKLENQVDCL